MEESFEAVIPRKKVGLSPSCGSMISLRDGRLMWAWGAGSSKEPLEPLRANFSSDGGESWSDPVPMKLEDGKELKSVICPRLVRLSSGPLGLAHVSEGSRGAHYQAYTRLISFHVSKDEGQTWSKGIEINPGQTRESSSVDSLIQLSDGRLILPFNKTIGPTPTVENPKMCRKFGEEFSNCFSYNLFASFCYYSDDEGKTWHCSSNETFATLERGVGGIYGLAEPQIAELEDGKLLMLANTPLGRLFRAYSEDRGETWGEAEPTDLVLRRSPLCLKRIPDTGDVLVIWSQISPWEAMQGLFRHRLSYAISKDGGLTWQHHKNLISLDDVSYLEPGPLQFYVLGGARQPLDRERYHRAPGPLRNDHPYCTFHNGKAVICYGHGVLGLRSVIEKTYGMDYEALGKKFGFEPRPKNPNSLLASNKVYVIPIERLYE